MSTLDLRSRGMRVRTGRGGQGTLVDQVAPRRCFQSAASCIVAAAGPRPRPLAWHDSVKRTPTGFRCLHTGEDTITGARKTTKGTTVRNSARVLFADNVRTLSSAWHESMSRVICLQSVESSAMGHVGEDGRRLRRNDWFRIHNLR